MRERLDRESGPTRAIPLREELSAIRRRCAALPILDDRTPDEILGYDERHVAGLNYGDCFAYALAKAEPLLFKGNDFGKTDITPAITSG